MHFCLGVILGYNVSVRDSSGTVSNFTSTTTSVVATQLSCCMDYTFQVSARTSAGKGTASEVGNFRTEGQYNMTSEEEILDSIRTPEPIIRHHCIEAKFSSSDNTST